MQIPFGKTNIACNIPTYHTNKMRLLVIASLFLRLQVPITLCIRTREKETVVQALAHVPATYFKFIGSIRCLD